MIDLLIRILDLAPLFPVLILIMIVLTGHDEVALTDQEAEELRRINQSALF